METLVNGEQEYVLIKKISSGGFGDVWLAENDEYGQVAVKIINVKKVKDVDCAFDEIKMEVETLKSLKFNKKCFRHVSCYYDSWMDKVNRTAYIVMEYIKGQELNDYLKSIKSVKERYYVALDILRTLSYVLHYIHLKGILHLDLKSSNILIIDTGLVKLIDFGLSCYPRRQPKYCSTSVCCRGGHGTSGFIAPETLLHHINYPATDIWLLGATFFNSITDQYVSPSTHTSIFQDWKNDIIEPPLLETGFYILDYVVNACLKPEPADRISLIQIINILSYYFDD